MLNPNGTQLYPLANILILLDKEGIIPGGIIQTDDGYIHVNLNNGKSYHINRMGSIAIDWTN